MITIGAGQLESVGYRYILELLEPVSPYGELKKRSIAFAPPVLQNELMTELKNVELLRDALGDAAFCEDRDALVRLFMQLKDLHRTVKRCRDAALDEVELFEIKRFLLQLQLIAPAGNDISRRAGLIGIWLDKLTPALDVLDEGGMRGATFFIPDNHTPELSRIRKAKREAEQRLRVCEDASQREKLNAVRVALAAEEDAQENAIRAELSAELRPYADAMLENMETIGALDLLICKAQLALRGGVLPELGARDMRFDAMHNPRIEDALQRTGREFTPISIELGAGSCVITGANMGGKSVALKTLALNVLLAHAGILPFAEYARLPLLDGLHIVSEDLENVDRGLSSFGAEIVRFNEVNAQLSEGLHMLLLDEFARGTNPDEGAAIVRGVTRHLNGLAHISVLTTHYDGVAAYAGRHYQVMGLTGMDVAAVKARIAAGENGVAAISACMDYGLFEVKNGETDCPKDALNICRLLALDEGIMQLIEEQL